VGHVAWRGVASLRREKASFEKIKRLEKEMEIAVRRGELIENSCSRHCKAIRRVRDCKDIVNGWDDPNDFSWWKDAFKILKPPSAREVDGGNGDD
jgi:hypothetical protein